MIVVLGRPWLDERGIPQGTAARVAIAATATGARVELVGSVADDEAGDAAITALGRAGVGHAAVLRTPTEARPLEAADVELGLRYLADCRVLVIAEPLRTEAMHAALEGAAFHLAQLVIVREPGIDLAVDVPESATVLEQPEEDAGAFTGLVGRYAAQLDQGTPANEAWQQAIADSGWEEAPA